MADGKYKRRLRTQWLTVGESANLLACAPRTITTLFDEGRLAGYRLPGPRGERRILASSMRQLMLDLKIPARFGFDVLPGVLLITPHTRMVESIRERLPEHADRILQGRTRLEAGNLLADHPWELIWLDATEGRADAIRDIAWLVSLAESHGHPVPQLIVLVGEDESASQDFLPAIAQDRIDILGLADRIAELLRWQLPPAVRPAT